MTPTFHNLTFHVITYGCQMNKHDSERVTGMLEVCGACEVARIEDADMVVFMTCCVREAADVRLYGQVASIKNIPVRAGSPVKKRLIAIGGCIGQRDGEELVRKLPHVDVVFGTFNLGMLPQLLDEARMRAKAQVQVLEAGSEFPTSLPTAREHAWAAWLPIMIGCNNFCSYCIVPYVRGREKSRTMEDILEEAARYRAEGVQELTLLGQNVNSYGRDLFGEPRFAELLRRVDELGFPRLRFATSHPKDISDEVIAAFGTCDSLMPSLHLPVQSGSNRVLELMNRRYTRENYLEIIRKLREVRPDLALSTDIIVGFPGETEADFQDTLDIVREVGYQQVFTFIYSKREGTPAAKMDANATREEIQDRFDRLVAEVERGAFAANQGARGAVIDVLFESMSKKDETVLTGHSDKNQTVHVALPAGTVPEAYLGKILPVRVCEAKTWYLAGELV